MSDNIFIKSKGGSSNFKDIFNLDTSVNYSPLPGTLHIQNKIDGSINDYTIKNVLTSEIPNDESEINNSLFTLFGGSKNYDSENTEALQNKLYSLFENNQLGGVRKGTRTFSTRESSYSDSQMGGKEAPAGFIHVPSAVNLW